MKKWAKKLILIFGAILVGLIIGEIFTRIYYHSSQGRIIRKKEMSRSIRVPIKKEENTLRIVFIGDSYTYGFGVHEEDTFVQVAKRLLAKELTDNPIECLNFSRRGANSKKELHILKNKALKFNPDLIILGFVLNDFTTQKRHRRFTDKWATKVAKFKPLLKLESFSRLAYYIDEFIFKSFSGAAEVHIDNLNSLFDPKRNEEFPELYSVLEEMISIISQRQGLVLFFPHFMKNEEKQIFYQEGKRLVSALCQKHQVAFIEVLPYLKDKPFYKWWLNRKDHHPNTIAHTRIGELIASQIKQNFLSK